MASTDLASGPAWYESGLLWGCVGIVAALILTVVAATMKDLRFLLIVAWPFAVLAAWSIANSLTKERVGRVSVVSAGGVATAIILFLIYKSLPSGETQSHAGFLQMEHKGILEGHESLVSGERFTVAFYLFNRGSRPVSDAHAWGFLAVLDHSNPINSTANMKQTLLNAAAEGQRKFSGSGATVGVNVSMWDNAWIDPLSDEQISGILSGKLRLYLCVVAIWRNDDVQDSPMTDCEYAVPHTGTNIRTAVWHNCD